MTLSMVGFAAMAWGGTLTVDQVKGPYTTVGSALADAQPLDVIRIHPGTYDEALVVTTDQLTIEGTDRHGVVLRNSDIFNPGDGFLWINGVTTTLRDLTLSGADAGRAARITGATVSMERIDLVDGGMYGHGATVLVDEQAVLSLIDVHIEGGDSGPGNGGLLAVLGTLEASSVTFALGRSTRVGGALWCASSSFCAVTDSTFADNEAGDGGAVYLEGQAGAWRRNLFCRNDALGRTSLNLGHGGAMWTSTDVVHESTSFQRNRAWERGGAVYVHDGNTTLSNTDVLGSFATNEGAALFTATTGALEVRNSLLGYATGAASEVVSQGFGSATIRFSAFYENGNIAPFDANLHPSNQEPPAANPQIGYVAGDCESTNVRPGPNSSLRDAGDPAQVDPDGSRSDIGSTGGPHACNRDETPGDGIDENCDGIELCWADTDGDGLGEPSAEPLVSKDLACDGDGESPNSDDRCAGFPDSEDCDGDGLPDGCDPDSCDPPQNPADDQLDPAEPGVPRGSTGCSCAHPGSSAPAWMVLVGLALAWRRRDPTPA